MCFVLLCSAVEDTVSSSESEEENSDNPSNWKLSAYTRQKARKRKPSNRNLNFISISTDDDDDNSSSEGPHSSSYEEDVVGEGESVSESSEAGAVGFLDDEAMEASFSSELEEMEYEGSGESEVDRREKEDGDERKEFIVDEAEEEKPYRPWTRQMRRRRRTISSSSNASTESNDVGQSKEGSTEETKDATLNLNQKLRKRVKIMESSESSLDDDEIAEKLDNGMVHDHRDTPNLRGNKKLEIGMASKGGKKFKRETDNTDSTESRQESSENEVESDKESSDESPSANSDSTLSSNDDGQDDEGGGESGDDKDTSGHMKWKRDLLVKAREAYDLRNKRSTSLRKLVYSDLPLDHGEEKLEAQKSGEEEVNLGGLFQLAKKKEALSMNHQDDVSLPSRGPTSLSCDWSDTRIAPTVKSLFITGSWGGQDARALLDEAEAMYGDFEDLETGEKYGLEAAMRNRKGEGAQEEEEEGEEAEEVKRLKKKKKLKAAFDVEYDDKEGGEGGFLENLKREVSEQEQRNREEFEGLDEQTRIQYEGFRPGTYVRMELKGIPKKIFLAMMTSASKI